MSPDSSNPSSSPAGLRRRFSSFAFLLAFVLIACSDPTSPSSQGAAVRGTLVGTVTLLGEDGPSNPPGRLTLHVTEDDLNYHRAAYTAVLLRRAGPERVYDFAVAGLAPGEYYVLACFSIGCGPYSEPGTGALRRIRINPWRTTVLRFGL
jgi:hypothetical protein